MFADDSSTVTRIKCSNCQQMGHYKSKCPNPLVSEDDGYDGGGADTGGADNGGFDSGAGNGDGGDWTSGGANANDGDWNSGATAADW